MSIGDCEECVGNVTTDLVTLEELALSNMWETSALVQLLERKGVLTRKEVLDMIQELGRREPTAILPRRRRREPIDVTGRRRSGKNHRTIWLPKRASA